MPRSRLLSAIALFTTLSFAGAAELPLPLKSARGGTVTPSFEGWYRNPDGSFTLSFGYFNRNTEEIVEIPIGPDNFIEPGDPDQGQPHGCGFTTLNYVKYQPFEDGDPSGFIKTGAENTALVVATGVSACTRNARFSKDIWREGRGMRRATTSGSSRRGAA